MTEEELKEMMAFLETTGKQPLLCDTPIPVYDTLDCTAETIFVF